MLQHDLGLECFSLDGFKEKKKAGNAVPPDKPCTCAAMAVAACVSDFHAAWEVPHPPYVWNISALRGLNLTPAFSSRTDSQTGWGRLSRDEHSLWEASFSCPHFSRGLCGCQCLWKGTLCIFAPLLCVALFAQCWLLILYCPGALQPPGWGN